MKIELDIKEVLLILVKLMAVQNETYFIEEEARKKVWSDLLEVNNILAEKIK